MGRVHHPIPCWSYGRTDVLRRRLIASAIDRMISQQRHTTDARLRSNSFFFFKPDLSASEYIYIPTNLQSCLEGSTLLVEGEFLNRPEYRGLDGNMCLTITPSRLPQLMYPYIGRVQGIICLSESFNSISMNIVYHWKERSRISILYVAAGSAWFMTHVLINCIHRGSRRVCSILMLNISSLEQGIRGMRLWTLIHVKASHLSWMRFTQLGFLAVQFCTGLIQQLTTTGWDQPKSGHRGREQWNN